MEIMQIQESYIGIMQIFATMLLGNIILLWMLFRGVSNAYLYGVNTFAKVIHSVMSLCVVAFLSGMYANIAATVNNWAYALASQTAEELPQGLQLFVENSGATEFVTASLIPSNPVALIFVLAVLVGLLGGMWTAPAPKE